MYTITLAYRNVLPGSRDVLVHIHFSNDSRCRCGTCFTVIAFYQTITAINQSQLRHRHKRQRSATRFQTGSKDVQGGRGGFDICRFLLVSGLSPNFQPPANPIFSIFFIILTIPPNNSFSWQYSTNHPKIYSIKDPNLMKPRFDWM